MTMGDKMRQMSRSYGWLYLMAAVIALLGRVSVDCMASLGGFSFDYISSSGTAVLDTICSVLTGSALAAFMFTAGLVLVLSTAACALYAALCKKEGVEPDLASAFLWGWLTALVGIACALVMLFGIFTSVQLKAMSGSLPSAPVLCLALVVVAAFFGTLIAAASLVVCACVRKAEGKRSLGAALTIACLSCGAVVAVMTAGTFMTVNQVAVDTAALGGWAAADVVVNLAIAALAVRSAKKPA